MIIDNDMLWATHIPVFRTAMELYKPTFVLELGVGIHSTSAFREYKTKIVSVENNKLWIEALKGDIIFHDLGDITEPMTLMELTDIQKQRIVDFYKSLDIPKGKNLLFVDNFASCRVLAINTIGHKFNCIIYHDSQPGNCNNYELINLRGFNTYTFETSDIWTSVMIKK